MCDGVGTRQVMCDYSGKWVYIAGECCKRFSLRLQHRLPCPGWLGNCFRGYCPRTFLRFKHRVPSMLIWRCLGRNGFFELLCVLAEGVDRIDCEDDGYFHSTAYNETNTENRCDNGVVVSRTCSSEGVWGAISYDGLCSRRRLALLKRRMPGRTRLAGRFGGG